MRIFFLFSGFLLLRVAATDTQDPWINSGGVNESLEMLLKIFSSVYERRTSSRMGIPSDIPTDLGLIPVTPREAEMIHRCLVTLKVKNDVAPGTRPYNNVGSYGIPVRYSERDDRNVNMNNNQNVDPRTDRYERPKSNDLFRHFLIGGQNGNGNGNNGIGIMIMLTPINENGPPMDSGDNGVVFPNSNGLPYAGNYGYSPVQGPAHLSVLEPSGDVRNDMGLMGRISGDPPTDTDDNGTVLPVSNDRPNEGNPDPSKMHEMNGSGTNGNVNNDMGLLKESDPTDLYNNGMGSTGANGNYNFNTNLNSNGNVIKDKGQPSRLIHTLPGSHGFPDFHGPPGRVNGNYNFNSNQNGHMVGGQRTYNVASSGPSGNRNYNFNSNRNTRSLPRNFGTPDNEDRA